MRGYLKILSLIVNALTIPVASGAAADPGPQTYMKSVERIETSSAKKETIVTYLLACGELFTGVLLSEKGSLLQVGVVVERSDARCSSLPVRGQFKLPLSGSKKITGIAVPESKRVFMADAIELRTRAFQGGQQLTVSWQETCRATVGVVLAPELSGQDAVLGVSMAQVAIDGQQGLNCPRDVRETSISGLQVSSNHLKIRAKPGQVGDLFALTIRQPRSFLVTEAGQLKITVKTSCRERPVGALFTGDNGHEVAVLLAKAPNVRCLGNRASLIEYSVKGLLASEFISLRSISRKTSEDIKLRMGRGLRLVPTTGIKIARKGGGAVLFAQAPVTCSKHLGIISGNDSSGNVAMAILSGDADQICHVHQMTTSDTLQAPLVGPSQGPMPKIFGLRIFGTRI